jgi:hypothetical protein
MNVIFGQIIFSAALTVLLTGCSRIQFAYNQLDWLIPYYVEDYVELTDSQDSYLEQRVDTLLSWHCSSHLTAYADLLRNANTSFQADTMSEEKLQHLSNQIESYWKEIKRQASPGIAQLLLSSSEAQLDELFNGFAERNSEWLDGFKSQTDEALREDYRQNMTNELERWFGPLLASQQQAVIDWSQGFKPLGREGLKMRQQWQAGLRDLMSQRDDLQAFNAGIEQLFVNPEAIRSTEYLHRVKHNQTTTIEMIVVVGGQLNDGQRKHLASMAESISWDFDQLACASEESVRHMTLK